MAQAVRERTGELAVMKTLGFGNGRIVGLVLAKSLLIAVVGGVIGLALGTMFVKGAAAALAQFFPGLTMSPGTLGLGLALAVLLGLVTGAWPAWRAGRLDVVSAFRRQ